MAISMIKSATSLKEIKRSDLCRSGFIERYYRFRSGKTYATRKTKEAQDTTQYCLDIVKKNDYENFLSVLLLPRDARAAAVAIRAFNVELAQIQDVTSEKLMARMRLQFWREAIDQIYMGNSPVQPVALGLQRAVRRHRLSKRWLSSLIDSREEQLENRQFASLAAVEDYSEKSNSSLYYLILQGLGIQNIHADHAASHLGKAEGIMRLIRGIPHLGAKRKILLPRDIMMKNGVSQEDIIRGSREQKVKNVIFDAASLSYQHMEQARNLINDVPKEARVCFLPGVAVSAYLRTLQEVHFDVFDSRLQMRNNKLPYLMLWKKICHKY